MADCEGVGVVRETREEIPRSYHIGSTQEGIFRAHPNAEVSECCLSVFQSQVLIFEVVH